MPVSKKKSKPKTPKPKTPKPKTPKNSVKPISKSASFEVKPSLEIKDQEPEETKPSLDKKTQLTTPKKPVQNSLTPSKSKHIPSSLAIHNNISTNKPSGTGIRPSLRNDIISSSGPVTRSRSKGPLDNVKIYNDVLSSNTPVSSNNRSTRSRSRRSKTPLEKLGPPPSSLGMNASPMPRTSRALSVSRRSKTPLKHDPPLFSTLSTKNPGQHKITTNQNPNSTANPDISVHQSNTPPPVAYHQENTAKMSHTKLSARSRSRSSRHSRSHTPNATNYMRSSQSPSLDYHPKRLSRSSSLFSNSSPISTSHTISHPDIDQIQITPLDQVPDPSVDVETPNYDNFNSLLHQSSPPPKTHQPTPSQDDFTLLQSFFEFKENVSAPFQKPFSPRAYISNVGHFIAFCFVSLWNAIYIIFTATRNIHNQGTHLVSGIIFASVLLSWLLPAVLLSFVPSPEFR